MFMNGIIVGLILGAAFMYILRRYTRAAHTDRRQRAIDAAALNNLDKSALEKLFQKYRGVPSWISLLEYQKTEWLNCALKEMWPDLNKAVQDHIEEAVEPMLMESKPAAVSSMTFVKKELGHEPIRVTGAKVYSVDEKQVILEMKLHWEGDSDFRLQITSGITITVQVKIATFRAVLRIVMDLTDKVPCVGAILASFTRFPAMDKYDLDYKLKAIGGSLNAIPGLAGMLDDTIRSSIESMMEWPERIIVPIAEGYDTRHLEFRYDGCLLVTLKKATGLKNLDTFGKSDPYAKLFIRKTRKFKSPRIDDTLNPVWNLTFEIPVDEIHSAELCVELYDYDVGTANDILGVIAVPLGSLVYETQLKSFEAPLWPDFEHRFASKQDPCGTIYLEMVYRSYTPEERDAVTKAEKARADEDHKAGPLSEAEAKKAIDRALANRRERNKDLEGVRGVAKAIPPLLDLEEEVRERREQKAAAAAAVSGGSASGAASTAAGQGLIGGVPEEVVDREECNRLRAAAMKVHEGEGGVPSSPLEERAAHLEGGKGSKKGIGLGGVGPGALFKGVGHTVGSAVSLLHKGSHKRTGSDEAEHLKASPMHDQADKEGALTPDRPAGGGGAKHWPGAPLVHEVGQAVDACLPVSGQHKRVGSEGAGEEGTPVSVQLPSPVHSYETARADPTTTPRRTTPGQALGNFGHAVGSFMSLGHKAAKEEATGGTPPVHHEGVGEPEVEASTPRRSAGQVFGQIGNAFAFGRKAKKDDKGEPDVM